MGFTSSRTLTALVTVAATLSGCSTPYREPVLDPPAATYPGLAQLAAQEPTGALDLFIIHGMCHHDADWAKSWLNLVATSLGTTARLDDPPVADPPGEIKIYRAQMTLPKGTIRAHAIVWSGLTKPMKDQLCYDQTNKTQSCSLPSSYAPAKYPYDRARLNALIKDDLINDCFADAVIYQGAARINIVQQMQAALLASRAVVTGFATPSGANLARASLANDAGLVVLSSSLGSKVVFDAILELTKLEGADVIAGEKLRDSTRLVIMAANQVPLLSLGDQDRRGSTMKASRASLVKPGVFPPDPLDALMQQRDLQTRKAGQPPSPKLKMVAFTDPSDLLSYSVQGFYRQSNETPSYEAIDVIVSNGPTVLGLFENPYRAHTGYSDTKAVMQRIACGHPADGCK